MDLKDHLEKTKPILQTIESVSTLEDIKEAMSSFEKSGERPPALQKVYNALLSVPVTSCEAER